jgi:flagellar basal body-associated protein FliL
MTPVSIVLYLVMFIMVLGLYFLWVKSLKNKADFTPEEREKIREIIKKLGKK